MEKCELSKKYCDNEDLKLIQMKTKQNVFDGDIKLACSSCRKFENGQFKLINKKMETKSEKPKVDVAAIVAKARAKTAEVKDSTKKVQEKNDSYRVVPGFKKYEFNGNILRNTETKIVIKFKTGRTKYQLKDDGGKSHNLSNDDIRKMMPSAKPEKEVKQAKAPKEPKVKKEKPAKVEFESNKELDQQKVADLSKKEIIDQAGPKHRKIYMLHLKGCPVDEINKLIDSPVPSIKRDIWRYEIGKTVL